MAENTAIGALYRKFYDAICPQVGDLYDAAETAGYKRGFDAGFSAALAKIVAAAETAKHETAPLMIEGPKPQDTTAGEAGERSTALPTARPPEAGAESPPPATTQPPVVAETGSPPESVCKESLRGGPAAASAPTADPAEAWNQWGEDRGAVAAAEPPAVAEAVSPAATAPMWTPDRDEILRDAVVCFVPIGDILAEIAKTPGAAITEVDVFRRVTKLNVERNPTYGEACRAIYDRLKSQGAGWGDCIDGVYEHVAAEDQKARELKKAAAQIAKASEGVAPAKAPVKPPADAAKWPEVPDTFVPTLSKWTPERKKLIAASYAKGNLPDLLAAVNALPGEPVSMQQMQVHASGTLDLRRDPAIMKAEASARGKAQSTARNAVAAVGEIRCWTPERDAILAAAWPAGREVRDIEPEINALPGLRVVRSYINGRAAKLGLRRPEGWTSVHLQPPTPTPAAPPTPATPPSPTSKLARALTLPTVPADTTTPIVTDMDTIRAKAGTWGLQFRGRSDLEVINTHARRIGHRPFALETPPARAGR